LPVGSIQVYAFPSDKNFTLMGFFSVLKNFVSHPNQIFHKFDNIQGPAKLILLPP